MNQKNFFPSVIKRLSDSCRCQSLLIFITFLMVPQVLVHRTLGSPVMLNPISVPLNGTVNQPFIGWDAKFDNSVNDVIAVGDGGWIIAGNSNEKVSETIKAIESGSSHASGGAGESLSRILLKHHTGKVTLTQWPMSAPDLFTIRHGEIMIYEKAYGAPNYADKPIRMDFGDSILVTPNTNGSSQRKSSSHPGNIDEIEFGKGEDKGNESLSMEFIVNRSGQLSSGTLWDMDYLVEYDPIIIVDRSSADFFLSKLNNTGQVEWTRNYAGDEKDVLHAITESPDHGILLFGTSSSGKSLDKSEDSRGNDDFWLIKVDASGNKLWDKTYGGNGQDRAVFIQAVPQGGYLLGGLSDSNQSLEKSESGSVGNDLDYWVIRIDEKGEALWDRTFDSAGDDRINSIALSEDGGFVIAGDRKDITGKGNGDRDFWVVKIDGQGKKVWETTLGGDGDEEYPEVVRIKSGFRIVGTSDSNASGRVGDQSIGGRDQWVVTLDENGQMLTDRRFGKSASSIARYQVGIVNDDNAHIITTYLDDRDVDVGLMKTDSQGDVVDEKRLPYDFRAPKLALSKDHSRGILFGSEASQSGSRNLVVNLRMNQLVDVEPIRKAPAMESPSEEPGGFVNYITLLFEVEGKIVKAGNELSYLVKEGEGKGERIRELEGELSRLSHELAQVEGELKSCEEQGDRTRDQIKEVENTILSRELEIIALQGQVNGVQALLDAAHCEHLKVGERLEFLKEEMSGYADKLKTAHTPGWHYVPGYGWLWTSPEHYPQVYSNARNGWLYYEPGTSEPWLYYDYTLEQWEEWFVDPALFSFNN